MQHLYKRVFFKIPRQAAVFPLHSSAFRIWRISSDTEQFKRRGI